MDDLNSQIERLEAVLRDNPTSPAFSRLASYYLTQRKFDRAIELCNRGTKYHPGYATGFLILARGLQQTGKLQEALAAYQKILAILPRCTVARVELQALLNKTKSPPEGHTPNPMQERNSADGEGRIAVTHEPYAGESIEQLAERLKGYKPIRLKEETTPEKAGEESASADADDLPIVSETLAEIFLQQKQYGRAIEAYRKLQKKTPVKSDVYEKKVREIEELKRAVESS